MINKANAIQGIGFQVSTQQCPSSCFISATVENSHGQWRRTPVGRAQAVTGADCCPSVAAGAPQRRWGKGQVPLWTRLPLTFVYMWDKGEGGGGGRELQEPLTSTASGSNIQVSLLTKWPERCCPQGRGAEPILPKGNPWAQAEMKQVRGKVV